MKPPASRPRGFANPEYMIVLVIVLLIIVIVVPAAVKAWRHTKDRALIAVVTRVRDREDAFARAGRPYVWTVSDLVDSLGAGLQIESVRADSTGWSVVVVDTLRGRRCAMFDGADLFRPSGQVGQPRELACW
ncbi:MAG TPA: hypothetical protein VGI83_04575 [Gemmatimonadales bacterium]|jgi:competence protein ComGC